MTALRDRASDADADEVAVPWDARPIVGARRGLPWWGAVALAFVLSVVGAAVDIKMQNDLAWVFRVCYLVGSVGAICFVRRRNLFGPTVQPPLVLAITVPGVMVVVNGFPANSDTLTKALAVGTPLINSFPLMAITTACTVALGILRFYRERNPHSAAKEAKKAKGSQDRKRPARPEDDRKRRPEDDNARPDDGRTRAGQPVRGAAGRGPQPPENRPAGRRRPTGENPLPPPPPPRRQPPDEGPRRGDPGVRGGGRTPPPPARRPRGPVPEEGDPRRGGGAPGNLPRRQPRRPDPRGPQGGDPRRAPGRNAPPPPPRRTWDDER